MVLQLNSERRKISPVGQLPEIGNRTLIMSVINVTPDSFSDGGIFDSVQSAVQHANQAIADGADILDIGGESTRPATFHDGLPLSCAEEIQRVVPVIAAIRAEHPTLPISIDTYKSDTARAAFDFGATILNDISALRFDPLMAKTAAMLNCPVILMHLPGLPRAIETDTVYGDIMQHLVQFFADTLDKAKKSGINPQNLMIDPGIGFGKNVDNNLEIIRRLRELESLEVPIVVGPSRKRFIGTVLGIDDPMDRVEGTCATATLCIANGASIIRGHDTNALVRTARMTDAVLHGWTA